MKNTVRKQIRLLDDAKEGGGKKRLGGSLEDEIGESLRGGATGEDKKIGHKQAGEDPSDNTLTSTED